MERWQAMLQVWRRQGITTKLALASGMLVTLIILVAVTGYLALSAVRRQTEAAIVSSMEIQRLVLEMNADLQHARRLGRDFFLRWPTIGFEQARATYAQGNDRRISEVIALSARLKDLIAGSDVSEALRGSDVNLNFYLSAADRYSATFAEAVTLVTQLAASDSGAQAQLARTSALLYETLQQANDPALLLGYREMQAFEKDYLVTRQRPSMQLAFNSLLPLRRAVNRSPRLRSGERAQALSYLDNYQSLAEEILRLDVDIRSKFNEFDLQADAVDPISEELITLANSEVQRSREQITRTSWLATLLLVLSVLSAVALAGGIAWVQHGSITRNVIKLTEVAGELQNGNLQARTQIDTDDELGQLADTFNTMAAQLDTLIHNLEERVAERTGQLAQANDEITALNERLHEENLRMGAELDVTRQLQQMILPTTEELQAVNGLEIAGYMEPADEVGGDYYDVLQENGQVKISIGDVTDHGLQSGVVMLMAQTAARTLLNSGEADPVRFISILNRTIYENVQRMAADRNLTLSMLDYVPGEMRLSGQHEEVIVVRQDGAVELVDTINLGFPIGLDRDIDEFIDQTTVSLEKGDGLVLYTDGITEAESVDGELYGLERLCAVVSRHWIQPVEAIKQTVIADVRQHIGTHKVYDDITLLIIKQSEVCEEV